MFSFWRRFHKDPKSVHQLNFVQSTNTFTKPTKNQSPIQKKQPPIPIHFFVHLWTTPSKQHPFWTNLKSQPCFVTGHASGIPRALGAVTHDTSGVAEDWCDKMTWQWHVDGWNPAPPEIYETLYKMGANYPPQLVNAGFQPSRVDAQCNLHWFFGSTPRFAEYFGW